MKITCDMAMDLIALYNDELASEDSRQAVKEHLQSCPACSKAYAGYRNAVKTQKSAASNEHTAEELSEKYKNIAKELHKRYLLSTGTTLLITAISIGIGALSWKKLKEEKRLSKANAAAKELFLKTYFEE